MKKSARMFAAVLMFAATLGVYAQLKGGDQASSLKDALAYINSNLHNGHNWRNTHVEISTDRLLIVEADFAVENRWYHIRWDAPATALDEDGIEIQETDGFYELWIPCRTKSPCAHEEFRDGTSVNIGFLFIGEYPYDPEQSKRLVQAYRCLIEGLQAKNRVLNAH